MCPMPRSWHVLIVDDDRELRDLVGRFLTEHGFRVSYAADGKAMASTLNDGEIDLITGLGAVRLCNVSLQF